MPIDIQKIENDVSQFWDDHIIDTLSRYIRIPALSTDFDPDWQKNGYLEDAKKLALSWLEEHAPDHWTVTAPVMADKTPLIMLEIPGQSDDTILMYGHLDKQPEMEGWRDGFGPWQPVMEDDKLYGRGGADDGYALFSAVAAIKALEAQNIPHARIVILIEFSEESGSPDLPPYLELCQSVIGTPNLVIALDSGTGDYERLWSTTSLRGMLSCVLKVEVLTEATHSGIASGIIPSSMRVMRLLLDRLEDSQTGEVLLKELHADIPPQRIEQAGVTAAILGDSIFTSFNVVPGLCPVVVDPQQLLLNNTWRPTLSVVGQQGLPQVKDAGNVTRAYTSLKISFRLPPSQTVKQAKAAIEQRLLDSPPYGATVSVNFDQGGDGWDAPPLANWLQQANSEASQHFYGKDAVYFGLGASIPFMSMLGEMYPAAQFLITGVLGPKSNAHGPNEFIHIPYAKKLTACISYILAQQYALS